MKQRVDWKGPVKMVLTAKVYEGKKTLHAEVVNKTFDSVELALNYRRGGCCAELHTGKLVATDGTVVAVLSRGVDYNKPEEVTV